MGRRGREPLRGDAAIRRLSVRVTEEEWASLQALARASSMTLSGMMAEALVEFAADIGERAPLCRSVCVHSLCPFHPRHHPAA